MNPGFPAAAFQSQGKLMALGSLALESIAAESQMALFAP